jgi:phage terminase Nu1 subunit (DNA packaging protein)
MAQIEVSQANREYVANMIANEVAQTRGRYDRATIVKWLAESYAELIADELVQGEQPDRGTLERYAELAAEHKTNEAEALS